MAACSSLSTGLLFFPFSEKFHFQTQEGSLSVPVPWHAREPRDALLTLPWPGWTAAPVPLGDSRLPAALQGTCRAGAAGEQAGGEPVSPPKPHPDSLKWVQSARDCFLPRLLWVHQRAPQHIPSRALPPGSHLSFPEVEPRAAPCKEGAPAWGWAAAAPR